jgi:hypothetical protein
VDGLNIDAWSKQQRARYIAGNLDPDRAARLEELPGWSWRPQEDAWEIGFAALLSHLNAGGDNAGPEGATPDGYPLRAWIAEQRARASEGTLEPRRRHRLETVPGWIWSVHEDSWQRHYERLVTFVEREGHARVPTDHVEAGLPLASWVIRHRQDHKIGRVPAERAALLEALPRWSWNVLDSRWVDHYEALRRYRAREGHALVPFAHIESSLSALPGGDERPLRLGKWVVSQRAQRKTGKLREDRLARLDNVVGWAWNPHAEAWEQGFEELTRYVEEHGHVLVPTTHVQNGCKLGSWLMTQHYQARKGRLAADRMTRLEQAGVTL